MRQGRAVPVFEGPITVLASINSVSEISDDAFSVNHIHLLSNAIIFSRNVSSAQTPNPLEKSYSAGSLTEDNPNARSRQPNLRNFISGSQRLVGGIACGTANLVRDTGSLVRSF